MAANLLFDRMVNGDLDPNFGLGSGGNQYPDEDDDNLFNWWMYHKISIIIYIYLKA